MQSHDAEFREGNPDRYAYSRNAPPSLETKPAKARVILFKPSGKYYTEEEWEIPTRQQVIDAGGLPGDSIGPFCMKHSKDFRRIGGGAVLVDTQEPWGYPHLFPGVENEASPTETVKE